ncbi:serine/threonine-protein kinase Nek3 isoform X1 [Nelusetta ayraudi]|uniref:serine/threonine-protein kinase Nek3 isoform X1 n=1 Tax=Nelusetta ayraudi TaxID=303726 RepID=UPI003F6FAC4F
MEKYSVQKVIGEGSFGRALLVRCKESQETLVIKEIQLPKNRSRHENSRQEAILLARMKHPHIVAFRDSFEGDNLLCIAMEYCGGGDLLQRIQQHKTRPFCVDDILRWFAQMCSATHHIHHKRVLHRDLKSKNIFLTEDATIKLGDFGSACILNSSKSYAHAYVGTPYYVAPEIWDNKPYNNKSDVWSLGCVLYELCTLQHPFQASSWKNLILKVCRGAYPPLPSHLPYELHYLFKQMFKTNPRDRPSVHTILTSHRASRLLRAHLSWQAPELEQQGRRARRWDREEGVKVTSHLAEKSLITSSTSEATEFPKAHAESTKAPRKQWPTEPSQTVLQKLADASLLSSDSMAADVSEESEELQRRKRWVRDPPEILLRQLEKAQLTRASSTFIVNRAGGDPLVGPLSQSQGDDTDGPEPDVATDEERLQPRSDDEDTDFEEDSPCDWMDEAENILCTQ